MNLKLITLVTLCIAAGMALRVTQPYRLVASDGELRLHCSYNPQIQPQELVVALYRGMHGNQRVCIIGLNLTHSKPGFQTEGPIRCKAEHSLAGVDLVVSGLRGLDTDLYRCTLEVLYPPPYRIGTGNGTLFHIPEKTACPKPAPQKQDSSESISQLLPVLVPAVIISSVVFVIIIIILTIKALLKQKRRGYPGIAAVTARRVDCRFGYENFL
ncbi:T-cell-specific surface glycoprotein CD28-like [Scleropages formosus]|uniref:T-cell-specific surface glycoprotein CD28-like n=1 Tax=Scleropages formosus TaxID=113540 RepID=A0A8C9T2W9_SCLFO|nr:T-cell-specific surface glycoprotein CD28-like [Scleropages formosus]